MEIRSRNGRVAPASVTTLAEGLEYVASLDGHLFTDVEASEPESTSFGGMPAVTLHGRAERLGEEVEFAVGLFEPRDGTIAAVLYVGRPKTWLDHQADRQGMVASIAPASDGQ